VADADEADDGSAADGVDLAAELDRGPGLESVVGGDTDDHAAGSSGRSNGRSLGDEPDRDPDIDPGAIRGREAATGTDPEAVDRRIVTERGSTVDHRPGATATERRGSYRGSLEDVPTDETVEDATSEAATAGSTGGDDSREPSPLATMAPAQRAALEPGIRTAERGIALQRQSVRTAVVGATTHQRQQRRLARTAASAPLELAAATLGAGADAAGSDREPSRRLELVDGLDAMYRRRLAEAGITSLEEFARADGGTVADAAGITEQRAASWIEQVRV